jgi:preprotein translocase subunit SecA
MDMLRQGIHLRGYAQKNPKQEYKRESFILFEHLLENIKTDVIKILSHVQVRQPEELDELERQRREQAEQQQMNFQHAESSAMAADEPEADEAPEAAAEVETFVRDGKKVGRNDPCPCGSGKKYKQCHGKLN